MTWNMIDYTRVVSATRCPLLGLDSDNGEMITQAGREAGASAQASTRMRARLDTLRPH